MQELNEIWDWLFGPVDESTSLRLPRRGTVPDVRGMTVAEARSALAAEGFKSRLYLLEEDPAPVMGLVVDQLPSPGKKWVRAKPISLTVLHPKRGYAIAADDV
jgi:beta-lactam-binding protein with PASTA domain